MSHAAAENVVNKSVRLQLFGENRSKHFLQSLLTKRFEICINVVGDTIGINKQAVSWFQCDRFLLVFHAIQHSERESAGLKAKMGPVRSQKIWMFMTTNGIDQRM